MDHLEFIALILLPLFVFYSLIGPKPKKEWEKMLKRLAIQPCPQCGKLVGIKGSAQTYESEAAHLL